MTGTLRLAHVLLLAAAFGLAAPPAPGEAQVQQDTVGQALAPSLGVLRDRIQGRYQVLPLQAGLALLPRYGSPDVQSIELTDSGIAINGAAVTGPELRARVAQDADAIIQLSYLDAATRQVLFGFGPAPGTAGLAGTGDSLALARGDTAGGGTEADVHLTGERVRIGGSISVAEGEIIDGDVVAVGGSVSVAGTVRGDVVAVGGSVELAETAVVTGEVTAVGGTIDRDPGAVVEGRVNEVAFGRPNVDFHRNVTFTPFDEIGSLIGTVTFLILLGLLLSLILLLARPPVEKMEYAIATSPWKAALVGLVGQIVFLPVLVLTVIVLAVSMIGIPLLILVPFALLALMIGTLVGFTAVAYRVGHWAEARFGWDHRNPYLSLLVGLGFIMVLTFFGSALGIAGGPLKVFAIILAIIGFAIQYVAWTTGFGALLLTRFGTRYQWGNGGGPEGVVTAPLASVAPAPEPPLPAV
ncbi:MAG: hypothetical protein ABR559_05280 [Gemmatimonadota bacterium]